MQRFTASYMSSIYGMGAESCGPRPPSENHDLPLSDETPDFVARAVALGFDRAGARALYRRILSTGRDVRARRITPAGGVRRVERLALAVALVGGAS